MPLYPSGYIGINQFHRYTVPHNSVKIRAFTKVSWLSEDNDLVSVEIRFVQAVLLTGISI